MKQLTIYLLASVLVLSGCDDNNPIDNNPIDEDPTPSSLTEYQESVIDYFETIALGFEFGSATKITRKWETPMKVYIGGEASMQNLKELESIISEINDLVSDGFSISITNDSLQSNYYVYFGTGDEYAQLYPSQAGYVDNNYGLFSVYWGSNQRLNRGHMYVDISRPKKKEQQHLLREEFTQSLGLANDSPLYPESIFQSSWTDVIQYSNIDRDLIRLLYHPQIATGLYKLEVDKILRNILEEENEAL